MATTPDPAVSSSGMSYAVENQIVRNRLTRSTVLKSTEEVLIEKLDKFIASLESRLDNFEHFFQLQSEVNKDDANAVAVETDEDGFLLKSFVRSRSNSAASLSSIKTYSINYLSTIHQRLDLVKKSVLRTSFTNLDYLYKTLDDQYNYLFPALDDSDGDSSDASVNSTIPLSNKEILSKKIITTIQYFDDKLLQIDDFINDNKPTGKPLYDYTDDSLFFNQLRYFNFNRALRAAQETYLHYYQLPLNWRENKFIIYGYRFSLRHSDMAKSVFQMHNETMNIWTHILGFLVIVYLGAWHYPSTEVFAKNSVKDNLVMYLFLAAAVECLVSSAVWHTYSSFAHLPTRANCACVDYTGITVLITCSIVAAEYCSFYSYPRLLITYTSFSLICGLAGFIFNWSPYFDRPECRSLRIGFFVGLAILGATTAIFYAVYEGPVATFKWFIPMVYKSFVWYGIGVGFYGGLAPERWRYDVIIDDERASCKRHHHRHDSTTDIHDHDGLQEMEEIEDEFEDYVADHKMALHDVQQVEFKEIIDKHFPASPTKTPYHNDFLSLWWVDYVFSSHNIWHICVVLGVVGHYSAVLEMFAKIVGN